MSDHMIETIQLQFEPQVRPSVRLESRNARPVAQPTNPAKDRDSDGPMIGGISAILLGTGFLIATYLH